MGKLSANNKLYIAIGVIVVVLVAAVFLLILPKFQESSDLQAQIDSESISLLNAQTLLARRQSAKANSAANEAELLDIANSIPDSPQLPTVIIEFQNVANAAGVTLEQISPEDLAEGDIAEGSKEPAYSILPIELAVSGQWRDIIDFLGDIDDLNRGVRVVSMTFVYSADDPETKKDESHVEATIGIEVYAMTAAATAPTALSSGSSGATDSSN